MKKYKEKLQFWWLKKTIKDGRDFDILMDDLGMLITILSGKFRGVSFRYSPLTVIDDEGLIDFRTHVAYNPKNLDVSDPKFAKLTTNILRILLADAIPETAAQKYEEAQVIDENRDIDFSQPLEERDIHEESTPVLEKRVSKRKPRTKTVRPDKLPHPEVQQPTKPKRTRARTTGKKRPNGK
jgi:hypothetical protein